VRGCPPVGFLLTAVSGIGSNTSLSQPRAHRIKYTLPPSFPPQGA
jgi:hypothetical protein